MVQHYYSSKRYPQSAKVKKCLAALSKLSVHDELIVRAGAFYPPDIVKKIISLVEKKVCDLSFIRNYDEASIKKLLDYRGLNGIKDFLDSMEFIEDVSDEKRSPVIEKNTALLTGLSIKEKIIVIAAAFFKDDPEYGLFAEMANVLSKVETAGVLHIILEDGIMGVNNIYIKMLSSYKKDDPELEKCILALNSLPLRELTTVKALLLYGENLAKEIICVLNQASDQLAAGLASLLNQRGFIGFYAVVKKMGKLTVGDISIKENIKQEAEFISKFNTLGKLKIMAATFFKGEEDCKYLQKMIDFFYNQPEIMKTTYDTVCNWGLTGVKELTKLHDIVFDPQNVLPEETAAGDDPSKENTTPADLHKQLGQTWQKLTETDMQEIPEYMKDHFRRYLYKQKLIEMMCFKN